MSWALAKDSVQKGRGGGAEPCCWRGQGHFKRIGFWGDGVMVSLGHIGDILAAFRYGDASLSGN